ncbi:MAG: DNA polymerase IV [Peptoniphilaceae bacterium]|nr:DNA polymerase IV [Peptoniphilaceae bacterium]MDY6019188.1 DNA polymerase IV [Anaerococcus sp.]
MERVILHSDMNSCYASIEAKLNPKLRGLPLAVAGNVENRHGIILAKSQEAKSFGVKTGDAIWQAKNKCPDLVVVNPHYDQYLIHSRMAKKIYYDYTNQVEPFGLDECFLDVTGSVHLFGSGEDIGYEIKERIKSELGITVSVGVSFNKIFAKLGSDYKKPDGLTVISKKNFRDIVWPLPVEAMVGVGPATKRKLNAIGIFCLKDLAMAPIDLMKSMFGLIGVKLCINARGLNTAKVNDFNHMEPIKSIGNSTTCSKDLSNFEEVFHVFQSLSFSVSKRLRENGLKACGIQVYVRDSKLLSQEFQVSLDQPTNASIILAQKAIKLFLKRYTWHLPVRAVGLRGINLISDKTPIQLDMLEDYEKFLKKESLDLTLYKIRKKYGKNSVSFASLNQDIHFDQNRTEIVTLPNQLVR